MFLHNSKYFLVIFLTLSFTSILFANQIKYDLSTTNPNNGAYFIGTTINDLKISFIDFNNNILEQNITSLEIKIGTERFFLQKESDFTYHLRNQIINTNMVADSKLIVSIITMLQGQYLNTKQTYKIGDISEIIKLKNNPEEDYKKLTIGQDLTIKLHFEDLINQQIKNIKCNLDSFDSENKFNCDTINECLINTVISKDTSNLDIYCLFDKIDTKGYKTYPLVYTIIPTLSQGIKIGNLTNPKDGEIGNPFEICFNPIYESGFPITNKNFKLLLNNEEQEIYSRGNSFCFKNFLVPYTTLNKDLVLEYNNQQYTSQINTKLKPGQYWTWFIIILSIIIFINLILILKAIFSRETYEDIIKQRDNYKNRLVIIKEQYLQGEINKKEFESKLNEYSIKISWLNERALQKKPSAEQINRKEKEINELNEIKLNREPKENKKAPKELLNALFSEPNKEKVQIKDEDLIIEETQVNDNSINELTKALNVDYVPKEKTESKIKLFFKNLFNKKQKNNENHNEKPAITSTTEKKEVNDNKDLFQGYNINENEFDIRKWQK